MTCCFPIDEHNLVLFLFFNLILNIICFLQLILYAVIQFRSTVGLKNEDATMQEVIFLKVENVVCIPYMAK